MEKARDINDRRGVAGLEQAKVRVSHIQKDISHKEDAEQNRKPCGSISHMLPVIPDSGYFFIHHVAAFFQPGDSVIFFRDKFFLV